MVRAMASKAWSSSKPTLFDMPISPYGARLRYMIYRYNLEAVIDIKLPSELGGLKSEEYMALHPCGKMPLLVLPSGQAIPESTVIQEYILDALVPGHPDILPSTPEDRAAASFIVRYMDIYFGNVMSAMYKPMGSEQRAEQLAALNGVIDVLERLCAGPYFCGSSVTTADVAALPNFVFMEFMLPRFFSWDLFAGRPKLERWWEAMKEDPLAAKVINEMVPALEAWEASGRWDDIGVNEQVKDTSYKWVYP